MTGSFVLAGTQFVAQEHGLTIKLLGIPIFFLSGCVATALAAATGDRSERALTWAFYIQDNPEVCVPSPVFCGLTIRKRR
jgi:hypothetical protein